LVLHGGRTVHQVGHGQEVKKEKKKKKRLKKKKREEKKEKFQLGSPNSEFENNKL
jgi:hypothetical protein